MPHFPEPFYRAPRRSWFVEVRKKQHLLGKHPAHLSEPKKGSDGQWNPPPEIRQAYHAKMAELAAETEREVQPSPASEYPFVAAIIDDFVGWLRKRVEEGSKAQRTLRWYTNYLTSFLEYLRTLESPVPPVPTLTADRLKPEHVYTWVDSQPGWKTGRRGAIIAVQRAFNWAARVGKLKTLSGSPLAGMEKPAQGRREQLVRPEEFDSILSAAKDQEFLDLLVAAWETGSRPAELFTVEASYFDEPNARWVFPVRLSKGKKVQRVVYLSDRVLEITRRLVRENPSGPIFRNTDGRPWCCSSVKCRFQHLRLTLGRKRIEKLGLVPPKIPRLTKLQLQNLVLRKEHNRKVLARRRKIAELAKEHGTRYSLYSFRHAYCTEALEAGLDAVTVSVLMGHRDTTMIARHYSHLTQRLTHLRESARKARGS